MRTYFSSYLAQLEAARVEVRFSTGLDFVSSIVIVLSSSFFLVLTFVKDDSMEVIGTIVEFLLVVVFIVEFVLRLFLGARVAMLRKLMECPDDNTHNEVRTLMQDAIHLGVVPRVPPGGCRTVLSSFPEIIKFDHWLILDIIVIVLAIAMQV